MPYEKRNQSCKNAAGKSGTFVTIKKDGGERTCWKSEAAFKKATAARHAKGVVQEMKITEHRLRQIIIEEIQIRLIDLYIDQEIERMISEGIEPDWDAAKWRARKKKMQHAALGAVGVGTVAGGLAGRVTDYEDQLAADSEERTQQNIEKSSTIEKSAEELNKQAGNFKAWMWSTTDTQTLPFPTNPDNHREAVLPLEWSVMAQVAMDKEAGTPQYEVNKLYLQAADSPDALAGAYNVKGDAASGPHKQFFNDFSPESFPFSDASELGAHGFRSPNPGIASAILQIDGEFVQQNLVYVPFDEIPDDYKMPLSGLTKDQLYKNYYYGQGMSLEEFRGLKGDVPGEEVPQPPDDAESLNPELIRKTIDRANSLKERRLTWRDYKKRKKVLA